jgi:hypothetical protein
MSSQGEMLDSNMVGLTGNQEDEKLEERTGTASAFSQNNTICGHCTQNDGSETFIKHANQKVFRDGLPMCLHCYNRSSGEKALKMKQFQKLSREENDKVMNGLDADASRLTLRAAKNPKRSQEEVQESIRKWTKTQQDRLRASTDFLCTIAKGIDGWYCCRARTSLMGVKILRVKDRDTGKWRTPTEAEVERIKQNIECCQVLVPLNQWFRGGVDNKYRCPVNHCKYHPFKQAAGEGASYYLVFQDYLGKRHYVPAEPPAGNEANHVAILKLMFCEENLPALLGDEEGVDHYWKVINRICKDEFSVLMDDCGGIEIEIKQPDFRISESRASLNQLAVGRGLQCAILPPDRTKVDKWWGQPEWQKFIEAMFAYFNAELMSATQWNGLKPFEQKFLKSVGHGIPGFNPLHPLPPHHPPHHLPHLALPPPPPRPPPHSPPFLLLFLLRLLFFLLLLQDVKRQAAKHQVKR